MQSEKDALIELYAGDAFKNRNNPDLTIGVWRQHFVEFADKLAALSAAEPVATVAEMGAGGMRVLMPHPPGSADHLPIGTKLYAAPPAPSVAVKVPPMPQTEDRRPLDDDDPDGYLESNSDWAVNNNDAVEWLADNHAAIRSALSAQAVPPVAAKRFNVYNDHGLHVASETGEWVRYTDHVAALSAQVQDVAGWQLVPKQPTEEMLDAYWGQTGESEAMRSRVHARAKIHYHVMLAAAPAKQEG